MIHFSGYGQGSNQWGFSHSKPSSIEEEMQKFLIKKNLPPEEGSEILKIFQQELKLEEVEIRRFLNFIKAPDIYLYIEMYKEIQKNLSNGNKNCLFKDVSFVLFQIQPNVIEWVAKNGDLKAEFFTFLEHCVDSNFFDLNHEVSLIFFKKKTPEELQTFMRELAKEKEFEAALLYVRSKNDAYDFGVLKDLYDTNPKVVFLKKMKERDEAFSVQSKTHAFLSLQPIERHVSDGEYLRLCEHYIGRESSLESAVKSIYNNHNQIEYGHFLHQAVLRSAEEPLFFKEDPFLMISFFAHIRNAIAKKANCKGKELFGVKRSANATCDVITYCRGTYEKLGEDLSEKQRSTPFSGSSYRQLTEEEFNQHTNKIKSSRFDPKSISAPIKEGGCVTYIENEQEHVLSVFLFRENDFPLIVHTPAIKTEELGQEILTKLFKEALSSTKKEELLLILGEIFWWICQLKPWVRGDPAIAEMFIKSIYLKQTGKIMPRWAKGIIPWASATVAFKPKEFAATFHTLFEPEDFKNPLFW